MGLRRYSGAARRTLLARLNQARFAVFAKGSSDRLEDIRCPNAGLLPRIWIDPRTLAFKCTADGARRHPQALFVGGDWDTGLRPMADVIGNDVRFVSCREMMQSGLAPEHTREFAQLIERMERSGHARQFRSREQVAAYMHKLLELYREIEREGRLKSQEELGNGRFGDEINCSIDREGRLHKASNGNHRLAIALFLGFPAVPVQVTAIHSALLPSIGKLDRCGFRALNTFLADVAQRHSQDGS